MEGSWKNVQDRLSGAGVCFAVVFFPLVRTEL